MCKAFWQWMSGGQAQGGVVPSGESVQPAVMSGGQEEGGYMEGTGPPGTGVPFVVAAETRLGLTDATIHFAFPTTALVGDVVICAFRQDFCPAPGYLPPPWTLMGTQCDGSNATGGAVWFRVQGPADDQEATITRGFATTTDAIVAVIRGGVTPTLSAAGRGTGTLATCPSMNVGPQVCLLLAFIATAGNGISVINTDGFLPVTPIPSRTPVVLWQRRPQPFGVTPGESFGLASSTGWVCWFVAIQPP